MLDYLDRETVLHSSLNRLTYQRSIKQIFPPSFVSAAKITHDLPVDVQAERLRALEQLHVGFFRKLVAFVIIAALATSNQVVPVGAAASRTRHNVIKRQVGWIENLAAVLAGVMIA